MSEKEGSQRREGSQRERERAKEKGRVRKMRKSESESVREIVRGGVASECDWLDAHTMKTQRGRRITSSPIRFSILSSF